MPVYPLQPYHAGRLIYVAVSLALPAVFCLSDFLMASLFLTFIVNWYLVFNLGV